MLGRGYYVDALSVIGDAGFAFIMPAVKNSKIQAAIEEHANGEWPTVSQYMLKPAEGKEFAF